MSEGKGHFWTSLPGILTGAAALISALAGAGFFISRADDGGSGSYMAETADAAAPDSAADNGAAAALDSGGNLSSDEVDNASVAVGNTAGGGDAAAADAAAAVTATDLADAGAGSDALRPIMLENACSKPISFWLAYQGGTGWTSSERSRWDIAADVVTRPTYNGNLLNAKSPDAYYYASSEDGTVWKGDSDFDGLVELRKTTMEIDAWGDYRIKLTCD